MDCGYKIRSTRVLALAITAMFASGAQAAGFALMEQNASGLGNAYSGQAAAAEDASTIFFNPAGMTHLPGRQVVIGGNFIDPNTEFNDKGSTAPFIPPATPLGHTPGGDGGDAGDLAFVPHGYMSWEVLPSQLWVGIGVGAPFGLKTDYENDWIGRFHGTSSEVKTININPSIAWKVNNTVSLGFGLNIQKFEAELANAVSYTAVILGGGGGFIPGLEGIAKVEGDDWGFGWNAGALFNISPATRIGIAYRSKIDYDLDGDVNFSNRPPALAAALPDGDIEADVEVPDTFSVGLSHQLTPKIQLLADYTWTGWDSVQTIEIRRDNGAGLSALDLNMHDTYRVGLGLNYKVNDEWKLRFGVAHDRSAVREGRTPRLPDEDRFWASVGVQWAFSKQGVIDVGYAFVKALGDAEINQPNLDPTPTPGFPNSPRGDLVGDYDAVVHILGVQARYSF